MKFTNWFKHSWNAFLNKDPTDLYQGPPEVAQSYYRSPTRTCLSYNNGNSIIAPIYNRIALDVASLSVRHVKLNDNGRFESFVNDGLDQCLSVEANINESSVTFFHNIALSVMDEGVVAVVPIDTNTNPLADNAVDIYSMAVGKITEWLPNHVKVKVFNWTNNKYEERYFPKAKTAIIENPFYAVMNESNSILQRLIRKLNLLDVIDEQSGSGKLDMIIQLPYTLRSESRKADAEKRRKELANQLENSKYGVAYIDGTEKVTQLNRSVENNLMKQIEYLTNMLYSQLGITQSILDGTADEKTMLNYYNRTIDPIISVIVAEFKRKFLTKTARTRKHSIAYFRDPFKLTPVADLAEISDKLTRNEIAAPNEIRGIIGWMPSSDPKADELRNRNISESKVSTEPNVQKEPKGGRINGQQVKSKEEN